MHRISEDNQGGSLVNFGHGKFTRTSLNHQKTYKMKDSSEHYGPDLH